MKLNIDKKIVFIVVILELFAIVIGIIDFREKKEFSGILNRPNPGSVDNHVNMTVESKNGIEEDIIIDISPVKRSKDEIESLINQAKREVEVSVTGENKDLSNVTEDLVLKANYCNGLVKASWSFDNYEVIDALGKLKRENIKGKTIVKIFCNLSCDDYEETYLFNACLSPPVISSKQGYEFLLSEKIKEANETATKNREYKLPDNIEGLELKWSEKKTNRGIQLGVIGIITGIALIVSIKAQEESEKKRINKLLEIDYPDIVSMLSLYVSAGISVKMAFQRIAEDYRKRKEMTEITRPGFEGILEMLRQINDGFGEIESYKQYGRRIGHKNYRKLSIILVQNIKKGSTKLAQQLEKEEQHTFDERKLRAKVAGEEASTKLLMPMMGLLGVVLIVLIFPAITGIAM